MNAFKSKVVALVNLFLTLYTTTGSYLSIDTRLSTSIKKLNVWATASSDVQLSEFDDTKKVYNEALHYFLISHSDLLCEVASAGDANLAADLLDLQLDINKPNAKNLTPIRCAAIQGHVDMIKLLIARGAKIDPSDITLYSHAPVVEALINSHALEQSDFSSILLFAAKHGKIDLVKLLINHKVHPEFSDEEGNTPLIYVVKNNLNCLAEELIHAGAKLDGKDRIGNTPLVLAAAENFTNIVETFISQFKQYSPASQALDHALVVAAHNKHLTMVARLLAVGAKPNATMGFRLLSLGPIIDPKARQTTLENTQIDLDELHDNQQNLLHWAAQEQRLDFLKLFIQAGTDPNGLDIDEYTPLMLAAWRGNAEIINTLLAGGAAINAQNKYNSTPLMIAVESRNADTVRLLIMAGADLTLKSTNGTTAKDLAKLLNYWDLVDLLHEGAIRQFYKELKNCSATGQSVRDLIVRQREAGVSKASIVEYMIWTKKDNQNELRDLLQYAIACDLTGKPSNLLSEFMHITQGSGFKRFFAQEVSYSVSWIKSEILKLQAISPPKLENKR